MRTTYRVLAYLIAGLVALQAAAMAFAIFGFDNWIESGNVMTKAVLDNENAPFNEAIGFTIHGIDGQIVIPIVALAFLVVSFLAKVPKGAAWAGTVVGLIVVQVLLGMLGHSLPFLGLLHGANAILLLGVALFAGWRVKGSTPAPQAAVEQPDRVVV